MIDLVCAQRTRALMAGAEAAPGAFMGILMDGERLIARESSANADIVKEMAGGGAGGFYVPWSKLQGRCAADATCEQAFSDFLGRTMAELSADRKEPLVATIVLPQRDAWQRDRDRFLDFIDGVLMKRAPKVYPALTTLPRVSVGYGKNEKRTLLVDVEPHWSEFALVDGDRVEGRTSVSYGYRTDPARFRLNDYLHDSTREWTGASAKDWKDGFMTILNGLLQKKDEPSSLGRQDWSDVQELRFVCLEPDAAKRLSELKPGTIRTVQWQNPALDAARLTKMAFGGKTPADMPGKEPPALQPPKTVDIYAW